MIEMTPKEVADGIHQLRDKSEKAIEKRVMTRRMQTRTDVADLEEEMRLKREWE